MYQIEKETIAYAVKNVIFESVDDIIEEIATVLPKESYTALSIKLEPLGSQIMDYTGRIKQKPGRKPK